MPKTWTQDLCQSLFEGFACREKIMSMLPFSSHQQTYVRTKHDMNSFATIFLLNTSRSTHTCTLTTLARAHKFLYKGLRMQTRTTRDAAGLVFVVIGTFIVVPLPILDAQSSKRGK